MGGVCSLTVNPAVAGIVVNEDAVFRSRKYMVVGCGGNHFARIVDISPFDLYGRNDFFIAVVRPPERESDSPAKMGVMVTAGIKPMSPADADGNREAAADMLFRDSPLSDFSDSFLKRIELIIVRHEGNRAVCFGISLSVDGPDTGEAFGKRCEDCLELRLCRYISCIVHKSPKFIFRLYGSHTFMEKGMDTFILERNDCLPFFINESPFFFIVPNSKKSVRISGACIAVRRGNDIGTCFIDNAPFVFFLYRCQSVRKEMSFLIQGGDFFSLFVNVAVLAS